MPIPNYDRQLLGQYIRSLENPDSVGFRDGKWYASPYDKNARGFGVDIVANKAAAKVAAGRPGRYLTEQEERDLRNAYIQTTQDTIDRQYHPYLRKQPLSDSKRVMATGLLYRGDSINMDKALSDAYYNGTDEDFQDAVTEYYKRKKLPEMAKHHSKFFDKKQEGPATIKELEPPHVTQSFESMQYQPPMKFSDGGFLQPKDAWDALSMREKAAMLKVAVRNGITSLQDIRQKYNEFAEGGGLTDEQYYSTMERVAEENNPVWNQQRAEEGLPQLSVDEEYARILNDNTYDYRGYYSRYPRSGADADTHWTDEFKTVWHPTFSDESRYSGRKSQYNPLGLPGGFWSGETFVPQAWQMVEGNRFAGGGHLYGGTSEKSQKMERKGGYVPSDAIRKRIEGYEGKAMTGAIDPLSGRYARNNSFESEARGFYKALPESIRERVLSNPELADNLYSYSYNVGAGNFKSRVVPALERYYAGTGSADDVASSMWASGDRKLRGLRLRREQERNGVLSALWDQQMGELSQMIDNPQAAVPEQPAFMPYDLGNLFPVVPASDAEEGVLMPSEAELRRQQRDAERQERRDRLQNMMDALNMVYGSSPDNPMGSSGIFGSIGALMYDDGGRIHIKPENKGKFTALKERTGHSATWFKENGTPAQKKMATFELNSRHWKHGEGGNLFEDGGDTGDVPNIFRRPDGSYFYSADGTETNVTPMNTLGDNPAYWTYTDAAGKTYTPRQIPNANRGEITQGEEPSYLDKFLTISNEHYTNPVLGAPARWAASWKNNTNPVKALWDSPFVFANPYVLGAKTVSNLASEEGIPKTIRLYNNSDGSYADRYAWQKSLLGDAFEATALLPAAAETKKILDNRYLGAFGKPQVPERYLTIKPQVRTRVGDVEINNPNLLYHLDRGDNTGAFNGGAYVKNGQLFPGKAKKEGQLAYTWWNKGKPYATSVKGQPMTRLMTTTEDAPGMTHVKSQNYPIGQWDGKKGLVLPSEYVNPEGVNVSGSTYTLDPDYGWRRVFAEDTPAAEWAGTTIPQGNITDNLLKWLGVPKDRNIEKSAAEYLTQDYRPEYQRMAIMLNNNGVDLTKIRYDEMQSIFDKRMESIRNSGLERFAVARPTGNRHFSVADFISGRERPVGEMGLEMTEDGTALITDITNYTRNSSTPVKGVQERGLNSAINISKSVGGNGVITGREYQSAPRQYHVVQKFKDRDIVAHDGIHYNSNMVDDYENRMRLPNTYDESIISQDKDIWKGMLELARAGEKERKALYGAPVWKLKTPTFTTPTKSELFDPAIINDEGMMVIDWSNPNIFRNFGGKLYKRVNYD